MKIERTKNAANNIVSGTALKLYQIIVPFFMRTVVIYTLGIQYLGLNSLFTSVLQVLNLAELGVGSAMVYSMYRPISEDDPDKICALLSIYRKYYRIIGAVIGVVGLVILPGIPYIVSGEIPQDVDLYVLYLLNLVATVFTYWLGAYKNSLFLAHQRNDVVSKITMVINTVQYALQAGVLVLWKNYYLYLVISLVGNVWINLAVAYTARKRYPRYVPRGAPDQSEVRKINQRVRDMFTSKVGSVIVDSADTIVISAFLGLAVLGVYQNYFYILTSVAGFIAIIFSSCSAGIGNSLIVETQEKNFRDLKHLTFLIVWLSGFCTACFLCLYQPFMMIWVGSRFCLDFSIVICLCIYFYVLQINRLLNMYKDAAGLWHKDRWRTLATALTNLGMNLVMVRHWGLYGVILSTVLSTLIVGAPWLVHNLFSVLFDRKYLLPYLRSLGTHTAVTFLICAVTYGACACLQLPLWPTFLVRAALCVLIPNALYLAVFFRTPDFIWSMGLVNRLTKERIRPLKKWLDKQGGTSGGAI